MKIVIAAGGTGGHLFPGIAIAEAFLSQDARNAILFLGTAAGIEARIVPQLGFCLRTVAVSGFKGKGLRAQISSLATLPLAVLQAAAHIRQFAPHIIIGLGGYISLPAVMAGRLLRVPTVIHEQNSIPGLANRVLARCVRRIFVSFEYSRQCFPPRRTVLTGLPLRSQFTTAATDMRTEPFCIFVCGGSQGARQINQAVAAMLPQLSGLGGKVRFIHQSGAADYSTVAAAYRQCGLQAQVSVFIDDMASAYRQAHVVISRAGAATLAELALCGRAAILIPYPFAAGNHQEINARIFSDAGAALLLAARELQPGALAGMVLALEHNRQRLSAMEQQAVLLARPVAARIIVDECRRLARPPHGRQAAAWQSSPDDGTHAENAGQAGRRNNLRSDAQQGACHV